MAVKRRFPERTCVGCFKKFPQKDLLALTRLTSGNVIINKNNEMNGRSVYLCRNNLCLKKAIHRKGQNAIQYGLKSKIPEEIFRELEVIICE